MGLARYQSKRNFARTREPGGRRADRTTGGAHSFVIQKHAARSLHYDFRLELDGVLKSWAVPKGVPTRQGEKRLAMEVEDHPLDYATFEGNIPAGNYGAGSVMVWDTGTYEVLKGRPAQALREGKVELQLAGKKLSGQWTLVRMRQSNETKGKPWLLIKTGGDIRPTTARADDTSAQSGRTMKQIADDKAPRRTKSPARPPLRGRSRSNAGSAARSAPAGKASAPRFVAPMKALPAAEMPKGAEWLFEVKLDGIRAIGIKEKQRVEIHSRRSRELTREYPEIMEALSRLPATRLVVDGEIVVLDATGRSSFQALQNLKRSHAQRPPVFYYVFDLLHLDGRDLTSLPLVERKAALETLLQGSDPPLRFSPALEAAPAKVWREIRRLGLEGVIAKRRDSRYEPGRRSGAWRKIKTHNEQEFVIGGYTPPQGSRKHFGALLVGYHERGKLRFASKVGTGFDSATLRSLAELFQSHRTSACPFAGLRAGEGVTATEMKRCVWLKPALVCQVRFLEWTRDRILRQPVFLGLREDKPAGEIVRERVR